MTRAAAAALALTLLAPALGHADPAPADAPSPAPADSPAVPLRHAYAEGALAQAVLRALLPLPGWRWRPGPPETAAIRLGLRAPDAPWAGDYRPLALARLQSGHPPRWVRVAHKDVPPAAAPARIRDFHPVEAGPSRARDAVHAVAYRLAAAAEVPEPVVVRRCRAEPGLCEDLSLGPAPEYVWGIFVHRQLVDVPGPEAGDRLARLASDPFGDQVLRRLGADWFLDPTDGAGPRRGPLPDLRGLAP